MILDHCYTSDAPCLPSRTAFHSGRFGIQTGVVGHGGTAVQPKVEGPTRGFLDQFDWKGLAGQLQKCGYHTAMISPFGQRHAAWHFYAGFNEIHNTGQGGMESAEVVQPVVDPLWTVIREGGPFHASLTDGQPGAEGFVSYLKYLEATDRKEGADALREKYSSQLKHFS